MWKNNLAFWKGLKFVYRFLPVLDRGLESWKMLLLLLETVFFQKGRGLLEMLKILYLLDCQNKKRGVLGLFCVCGCCAGARGGVFGRRGGGVGGRMDRCLLVRQIGIRLY